MDALYVRQQEELGNHYGPLTDAYYESSQARDFYENNEAKRRNAALENDPLENISADEIRAAIMRESISVDQHATDLREMTAAKVFCQSHPEYVQNDRNAQTIVCVGRDRGLDMTSPEIIEELYYDLANRNMLDIDQAKVREQGEEKIRDAAGRFVSTTSRRASGISSKQGGPRDFSPMPSEDELNGMSYAELESRARKASQENNW